MIKKKKVIIIGAGLAGMSAGYHLQNNGFDTEIFELHYLPGGLCTSWKRKDYMIDGCIHFMTGISPKDSSYQFWSDLLDMEDIDFAYHDVHCVVEDKDKERISFYSDTNRLEAELLSKAPEDKKQINKFIKLIRKFSKLNLPVDKPYELMNMKDKLKVAYLMTPFLPTLLKYVKISNKEFASKFKNPKLREAFTTAFIGETPSFYSILTMVWRNQKAMGYPRGGAVHISSLIEKKYKEAGGEIHYSSRTAKIIVENNEAKGIELENGDKHYADIVVSAADGRSTIYDMLEGKYKDENIIERYEGDIFETIDKTLYVSLGINKNFSDQPHKMHFQLKKPIRIDPMTELNVLESSHFCNDPSSAPKGKTLLSLMPESKDWEYWTNLRDTDMPKYKQEKLRIANEIIDGLDNCYGNVKENIEMIDVSTPATYIHYTNNWTGGQISWKATHKTFGKPTLWKIKGLSNFYMSGQWAGISGGLANVVMMGNHLTQIICKDEGVKFSR